MPDPIYGVVRRGTVPDYNDAATSQIGINPRGEQLVVTALPNRTEFVRLGNTWTCQTATGSAFAPVAAMPTTLAVLAFSGSGRCRTVYRLAAEAVIVAALAAYQGGLTLMAG